jgi:hypothetical protein
LQLGPSHIVFTQSTKDGANSLLLVSPQVWNGTSIKVNEGETLAIQAGGRVHIDLTGLARAMEERRKAEERIAKSIHSPEGTVVPEDHYTDEEKIAMTPRWGWCGPDGIPEAKMRRWANPKREARSILPDQPYGVLVGAFNDKDFDPAERPDLAQRLAQAAFRVGSSYEEKATGKMRGFLYFAVNDVQYSPSPGDHLAPDFFFEDNIGTYYVKVEVKSK